MPPTDLTAGMRTGCRPGPLLAAPSLAGGKRLARERGRG
ncbi:hypothetical protein DA2_0956 [Desulfovibrio sp. A2]|nr:hypothetical protein DA2_0956 [Desulfovibrio sp. A2]